MTDTMKTRDAGFPAFFVSPSRPRGADKAERRDATEGQEGGTGKMRFALIRDCVQARGLRATSNGQSPFGLIRGALSHRSKEYLTRSQSTPTPLFKIRNIEYKRVKKTVRRKGFEPQNSYETSP